MMCSFKCLNGICRECVRVTNVSFQKGACNPLFQLLGPRCPTRGLVGIFVSVSALVGFWRMSHMGLTTLPLVVAQLGLLLLGEPKGGSFATRDSDCKVNFREAVGIRTNFEAEFSAVISGFEHAQSYNVQKLWIECDSVAVVILLSRGLAPWFLLQRWRNLGSYLLSIQWKITHCHREINTIVDYLSKSVAKYDESKPAFTRSPLLSVELEKDASLHPRYRFL
ncbi:uncharacterized protein LOC122092909 [Macadamia integrifolia]|uniref:uncharacterized protein LOC122092909 n=1 Tax=Macadamia integrifolia TaxID=60698 RepID=UPI001C4E8CDA|nr:uncharacterized protein LOC122092909 [Macadamia integrifolia]